MLKPLFAALTALFLTASFAQAQTFPTLVADDLNGRSVTLPRDLPGQPTIVFIAYKQRQQPQINAWVQRLGLQQDGGPAWVELPVVGSGAKMIRSIVDNGMRSGITSKSARAKTITIYSSRRDFNRALGIQGRNDIYVALVDPNGKVRTLIKGRVTEAKVNQLRKAYQ